MPSLGTSGSVPPDSLYTFMAWTRENFLSTVTFIRRARGVVENAFGNLASRFRVLAKSVEVKLSATDVTITHFCVRTTGCKLYLDIVYQQGLWIWRRLIRQKFNLDHGARNEVDRLPSANHVIQLSVKSCGKHKISACWLLRRQFHCHDKMKWWRCRLLVCDNVYT